MAYKECSHCSGTGLVLGDNGDPKLCSKCKGDTVEKKP